MICPHCLHKNPNGSTEHDLCRACKKPMVAPKVEAPKVEKTVKKAKTTKKA